MTGVTPGILVFVVFISVLLTMAVLSNILVIYCMLKFKKLRTVTNMLICNLAVSDLFLAGFVMPQRLHDISHREDFFEGDVLCKTVNFFPIFVISSSIYTLVCVSFERHRAIIHSSEPQMTIRKTCCMIPCIWIFSLAIAIPTLVEYSVDTMNGSVSGSNGTRYESMLSCGSSRMPPSYALINAVFVTTISYVIPVIIMMKNYLQVAMFVWRKGRQISETSDPPRGNNSGFRLFRRRVKLVKILVLIALLFAVSWLPFFLLMLYAKITRRDASHNAAGSVNLFMIFLATFSTVYNIVLYVIYHPTYREAFKTALRCTDASQLDSSPRGTHRESVPNGCTPGVGQGGIHTITNHGERTRDHTTSVEMPHSLI